MKKDCEVVRDLMPLVLDDVASDGSKHMVSAHVQTCAECAAYMNQLKADLPAGKKSELDSRAAFDAAAQTLRKQKRRRTLRNVLLGALIVCILGLANLYCFDWLMNETRPIPTSEYGIQLSQLADGRLVASFDYHESTTPLYVKRQQVTETAADESRAEILYLCAESISCRIRQARLCKRRLHARHQLADGECGNPAGHAGGLSGAVAAGG